MKMIDVSIIMPVFNVEKVIGYALDSIVNQTFDNWECIIVDDGSKDSSGSICDDYSSKDSRFKVFHKINGGVSSARQYGLERAIGEYIIHVDPDDWIEQDMLQEMYACAVENDADMVISDFFFGPRARNTVYSCQKPKSMDHWNVLYELFCNLHGACWNKLVRKSTIDKYNVKFPEHINFCEDLCFNSHLLYNAIKVAYLPKAFYHYVTGDNLSSECYSYNMTISDNDIALYNLLEKLTLNTMAYDSFRQSFSYLLFIRAYKSDLFSDKEFSARYSKYLQDASARSSRARCLSFWLSCKGLHSYVRKIELLTNKH